MDVPLRLKDGSVYGSFCCLSRTPDHSLTQRDLLTLRAFADLASGQIEKGLDLVRSRTATESRISDAIAGGQPAVVLQPIHNLASGDPIGVEALARFPGGVSPDRWFATRPQPDWGSSSNWLRSTPRSPLCPSFPRLPIWR
jgi:hypothetical protein